MPSLPRLPRRQPWWRSAGIKVAAGASQLAAWIGIGFAAMAAANTAGRGSWGAAVIFTVVLGAGGYLLWNAPRIVRAARIARTPKRHRRDLSTRSQGRNPSNRVPNERRRRG